MYYVDVKSTFGNEREEQSTGTAEPVFTAERTRARKWCKELRNAPGRTLDVLVAGATSGMAPYETSPELPAAWHPAAAQRTARLGRRSAWCMWPCAALVRAAPVSLARRNKPPLADAVHQHGRLQHHKRDHHGLEIDAPGDNERTYLQKDVRR